VTIAKKSFYVENLGCAKNQVDAEIMISVLEKAGWAYEEDPAAAGVILVNTCGFIKPAKEESIKVSFDFLTDAPGVPVVMTGCLSQRYAAALSGDMAEIAGFFGNRDPKLIVEFLEKRLPAGERVFTPDTTIEPVLEEGPVQAVEDKLPPFYMPERSRLLSFRGSAYVKVAEGCRNRCTFCAIPLIRGNLRSRTVADVVVEIHRLMVQGYKEFNLIAQDLNAFGRDRGASEVVALLEAISAIKGDFWVRPMYLYPDSFDRGVLEVCQKDPRILPYFDIPFQHASQRILQKMGRAGTPAENLALIRDIRAALPDATIRTSLLVGFPGETDADLDELLAFQAAAAIDWLGAFTYSPEEGTLAASLPGRPGPRTMARRKEALESAQVPITARRMDRFVGRTVQVLIEEAVEGEDLALGRTFFQAPEVDGLTVVHLPRKRIVPGSFVNARLDRRNDVDMEATAIE
jgi:ribosomal protein S12 methylthiotransferase